MTVDFVRAKMLIIISFLFLDILKKKILIHTIGKGVQSLKGQIQWSSELQPEPENMEQQSLNKDDHSMTINLITYRYNSNQW